MPSKKQLCVVQLNAENLFLFLDQPLTKDIELYSEKEWQRLSSSTQQNKSLHKTRALGEALLEIDPDLIMLNEVGGLESITNFNKYFLHENYVPHLIEGNSDRGIDCGYLVKKTLSARCLLKSHKDRPLGFLYPHEREMNAYWQNTNPERLIKTHYFARDCLELRLFRPESNELAMVFLLVHLKSKLDPEGIDPSGRERRAAELKTLVEIYNEILAETQGKIPICVGGDFNGTARKKDHETEFAPLHANTELQDAFDVAELSDEQRATQIQIQRSGKIDLLQIDSVFMSPSLASLVVKEGCYVYRYKNELKIASHLPKNLEERMALPSDHYPVVATFKIAF